MEQMNLWDFVPECENGRLAHTFLYFSEEAHDHWKSPWYETPYSRDKQLKCEQMDIFEILNISEEEIYRMSNIAELSNEELKAYLKYMTPIERAHWVCHLHFFSGFPLYLQEENFAGINGALKDRFKEEPKEKPSIKKGFRGYHGEESSLKKFLKQKEKI